MSVFLLCASVVLGGGTRAGVLGDVVLQFVSVPVLLAALWLWADRLGAQGDWRDRLREPQVLLGCAFAGLGGLILLAQFVPLFGSVASSGIWNEIARHGGEAAPSGTGSSSVMPDLSAAAVAAVLPPLALFLLVALLGRRERMRLAGWATLLGLVSLALGVLQILSGPASPLRFHWPTNTQEAVGFFANRNHFAAQMYATLLLGLVWLTDRWQGRFSGPRFTAEKAQALGIAVSFALLAVGAIALARSRAGIILTLLAFVPLVAAAPAMLGLLTGRRIEMGSGRIKAALGIGVVVLVIAALGAERALPRFEESVLSDLRGPLASATLRAAWDAFPSGAGLASFVQVYQVYETEGTLRIFYANRAHNDWAEFLLETGLPGILLVLVFLAWFGQRSWAAWFGSARSLKPADRLLERIAALVVLLLLLHSFLDYPLRTGGMLATFALCCGFLTPAHMVPAARPRSRGAPSGPRDGALAQGH